MTTEPIYLIYLDAYHLDDRLYVTSLAQMMGRLRAARSPCLFVHGSGEQAERLLEAEGLFPEPEAGVLYGRTEQEARLVERALRQVNRRLVGALTEEGVAAVGLQGKDRGLLRFKDEGAVTTGEIEWLRALIVKRVVPVVSTLVKDPHAGYAREVRPHTVLVAMAQALGSNVVVVFLTRNNEPGVLEAQKPRRDCALQAVSESILPEPEALRGVVEAGCVAWLTSAVGLFGGAEPLGTCVFHVNVAKKD